MKRLFVLMIAAVGMSGASSSFGLPQASAKKMAAAGPVSVSVEGKTFKGKADVTFPSQITVSSGDEMLTLVALGSGLRKKAFFKVYEAAAYAEENASLNADPYGAILGGSFATRIVMHFLRNVGGKKIRGAWQDGFDKYLGDDELDSTVEKDRDTFLGYFTDTDLKKGETIQLTWLPGLGLYTEIAGQPKPPINNPKIAAAVLSNWFGEKPISSDLKKDLVRFLSE